MKILDTQIKKQGFTYDLIVRSKFNALYTQKCDVSGRVIAFEVFKVNKNEERVVSGNTIAASESMASNEQFGSSAWCFSLSGSTESAALEKAKAKFTELELKVEQLEKEVA